MLTTIEMNSQNFDSQISYIKGLLPDYGALKITIEDQSGKADLYKKTIERFNEIQKLSSGMELPQNFDIDKIANESNLRT